MLSHKNILSNVKNVDEVFDQIGGKDARALSFLPLNHIFERMVTYIYLYNGTSIYYAESLDKIGDNLTRSSTNCFLHCTQVAGKSVREDHW